LTCMCMYGYSRFMRTTIEIPDEQRARLLEIAGARGEKGYSRLVQEAIDLLLKERRRKDSAVEAALAQRGVLRDDEADEFEERVRQTRESWR
jgi:predicted transcriptional regulator